MSLGARSSLSAVAILVGDTLRRHGIAAVLTGGACASLHSGGAYQSLDVDFVLVRETTVADLDAAMASIGFRRKGNRYVHPRARYFVEFPRGPLAVGRDDAIRPVAHRSPPRRILLLSATDSCRDRLAAFYHWSDRQSLEAAVQIAARQRVRMQRIRTWSEAEGHGARFEEFREAVTRARHAPRRRHI